MSEMEDLMHPFGPKFEETLESLVLPSCEIEISFDECTHVVCGLLDIATGGHLAESLQHSFSLCVSFSGDTCFQSMMPSSP